MALIAHSYTIHRSDKKRHAVDPRHRNRHHAACRERYLGHATGTQAAPATANPSGDAQGMPAKPTAEILTSPLCTTPTSFDSSARAGGARGCLSPVEPARLPAVHFFGVLGERLYQHGTQLTAVAGGLEIARTGAAPSSRYAPRILFLHSRSCGVAETLSRSFI